MSDAIGRFLEDQYGMARNRLGDFSATSPMNRESTNVEDRRGERMGRLDTLLANAGDVLMTMKDGFDTVTTPKVNYEQWLANMQAIGDLLPKDEIAPVPGTVAHQVPFMKRGASLRAEGGRVNRSPEDRHADQAWLDEEARQNHAANPAPVEWGVMPSVAGQFGDALSSFLQSAPSLPFSSMPQDHQRRALQTAATLLMMGESPISEMFAQGKADGGATLSPGPEPTGRDKVFDAVYGFLGGKPEKRWAADKITDVATLGGMAPWTAAYDGGKELAQTGRPASLATAILPGARVAAPVAKAAEKAVEKGIRAFHGSPHDFDRFDISKIGTGEGAQAYGHGLYMAENEAVARGYRDALAGADIEGTTGNAAYDSMLRRTYGGDWEKAKASGYFPAEFVADVEARGAVPKAKPRGHMYEVNINASPDDFLDWDKPLSQQSEKVRAALNNPAGMGLKPQTVTTQNGAVYSGWVDNAGKVVGQFVKGETPPSRILPDHPNVSVQNLVKTYLPGENTRHLAEAGIPGIRYLDQGSRYTPSNLPDNPIANEARAFLDRADGDSARAWELFKASNPFDRWATTERDEIRRVIDAAGRKATRNYVVFDDAIIDIVRKYGIAGLLAAIYGGSSDAEAGQTAKADGGAVNSKFLTDILGSEVYDGPELKFKDDDFLVNKPERPKGGDGSVLTQGYDRVLPSHEFWDRYVSSSPDVHDRIGRLQAAGLAAVNGLGFGLPMAAAHRLSPDAARRAQAVMDAYPTEKTVASVGSAIANPANVGLRAAGNALAAKGYGIGAQAAADGATALGISVAPEVVRSGGLPRGGDIPAATAMTARFMMPTLPASLVERTLRGAQAGVASQLPAAVTSGDVNRLLAGGIYGASYGAGAKMSGREPKVSRERMSDIREDYFDMMTPVTVGPGVVIMANSALSGGSKSDGPPLGDPQYPHLSDVLSAAYGPEIARLYGSKGKADGGAATGELDAEAMGNYAASRPAPSPSGWDRDDVLPFARRVENGVVQPGWHLAAPKVLADAVEAALAVGSAPIFGAQRIGQGARDEMIAKAGSIVGPMAAVGLSRAAMGAPSAGSELGSSGGRTFRRIRREDMLPRDDASRKARGRDAGFDVDTTWYHGSPHGDLKQILPGQKEPGAWFTTDISNANNYARGESPGLYSVHLKATRPMIVESASADRFIPTHNGKPLDLHDNVAIVNHAIRNGYDSVHFPYGNFSESGNTMVVFDGSQVRSTDAMFDPTRLDRANLNYSVVGPTHPAEEKK